MHDNTLAAALTRQGVDLQLIPTYTPIRTDEEDVSIDKVFFGGINVFLEQKLPLYRFLPAAVRNLFDRPSLIRWATRGAASTSGKSLGAMTVSMLRGDAGYQAAEVEKLCKWLGESARPDLVNFTNILIAGCIPHLKRELGVPAVVTLQGDDIFIETLPEPYKSRALDEIHRLVEHVDAFLTHSRYYADFMSEYFGIPPEKVRVVPLGIDTQGFPAAPSEGSRSDSQPQTIGYFARLAPEKGLHLLVDAFIELHTRDATQDVRLRIAGWLGDNNRKYAEEQFAKLLDAGLQEAFEYMGSVSRDEKIAFLRQIDVFSVPTTYREPKGLFVLEALAAGTPVVQPDHGAFPELIAATGGGRLVAPDDPIALADGIEQLLSDHEARSKLATNGSEIVHRQHNADVMARTTLEVLAEFIASGN
jgi:glycosyltransferase involved in cell wall biosynthesis